MQSCPQGDFKKKGDTMEQTEKMEYTHKVQYYETDQMGIVHHSNYIRWFEEARSDVLEKVGMGYDVMEASGVISPVLEAHAVYRSMTRYGEQVKITVKITAYNGIRLSITYEVADAVTGELRCTGETAHCFLDKNGKPISLKRKKPEMHKLFEKMLAASTLPPSAGSSDLHKSEDN